MATTTTQGIPPVPYQTPIVGKNGLLTNPWAAWFRQIFTGVTTTALTNPMNSLGDTIFGGVSGAPSRLPGNITDVKKFLVEVGDGVTSSDPTWGVIDASDIADINLDAMSSGAATIGQIPEANGSSGITWVDAPSGAYSVSGTRTSPNLISAAGGITSTMNDRQLMRVSGNGSAVTITANPSISNGVVDGQELVLEGCDITNTLTINNGGGTEQAAGSSMILSKGDKIAYHWDADIALWTEDWRFYSGITAGVFTDASGNPFTDASGNPFTNG